MPEAAPPRHGRFVWRDLMTTDVERSIDFYTRLFDWQISEVDMGPAGTYKMIKAAGRDSGGVVGMDPADGIPPHWIAYVTVPDVDAAVAKAVELGGQAPVAATDIPGIGRFAVVADPHGATISPFTFAGEPTPEEEISPPPGRFVWAELLTPDAAASRDFYRGLFGWDLGEVAIPDAGPYTLFRRGPKEEAGAIQMPAEAGGPPLWLQYVAVADVDASAARAEVHGATVHAPPRDIPGVGRFAVLADPLGAMFALYKPGG